MPAPTEPAPSEYAQLAHAMQSGVAMMMQLEPDHVAPKHLRVGVNSSFSSQAGMAKLLMAKGVFTQEEYEVAVTEAMREEVESYKTLLSAAYGVEVHLA